MRAAIGGRSPCELPGLDIVGRTPHTSADARRVLGERLHWRAPEPGPGSRRALTMTVPTLDRATNADRRACASVLRP
jgi:hypothetical protein